MQLAEIIIQRIKKEGPISFHDFMEMALYYPEVGYYTAKQEIGEKGDFYTSSNLTPAFGAMIGKQLEEMWRNLGENAFTIVEYGAGTGSLCQAILDYLKGNSPLYNQLNYCIIEKSPAMRQKERKYLPDKVSWHNSIQDLRNITGCILCNELVDNFSVHQVIMEDELMEVFVDYNTDFTEVLKPAKQSLKDYLNELNVNLPKGFRTEINLEATEWIKEISQSLKRGYLLTIDYGFHSSQLYRLSKSEGTLLCYHKHRINGNPYKHIGEQDITSHVNFSALCHWGFKNGLECCGLTDQRRFLLSLGFSSYLTKLLEQEQDVVQLAQKAAIINRILLLEMGSKFKVLIQQKGIPKLVLQGLRLFEPV